MLEWNSLVLLVLILYLEHYQKRSLLRCSEILKLFSLKSLCNLSTHIVPTDIGMKRNSSSVVASSAQNPSLAPGPTQRHHNYIIPMPPFTAHHCPNDVIITSSTKTCLGQKQHTSQTYAERHSTLFVKRGSDKRVHHQRERKRGGGKRREDEKEEGKSG